MHPGWQTVLLSTQGLERVARSQHGALLSRLGITPCQPPEPVPVMVQWLSLSAEQRQQALLLVKAICFAQSIDRQAMPEAQWLWCRGLAKALRPGFWLPSEVTDPRSLLAGGLDEACWARLRLSWAPDDEPAVGFNLPVRKLQALWRAVLWKVSQ